MVGDREIRADTYFFLPVLCLSKCSRDLNSLTNTQRRDAAAPRSRISEIGKAIFRHNSAGAPYPEAVTDAAF